MLKSLKKHSYRFVVVLLLLTTLLTFNVGRVTKVEAVATTAAIAAAALLGTGAIYLGYLTMTGAEVRIPNGTGADIQNYLTDIGRKVVNFTSGASIYSYLYTHYLRNGLSSSLSYDYSIDHLKSLYNDFKDIVSIQEYMSFYEAGDDFLPTNGFQYTQNIQEIPAKVYFSGSWTDISDLTSYTFTFPSGTPVLVNLSANDYTILGTTLVGTYRNLYDSSTGRYYPQKLTDLGWENASDLYTWYGQMFRANGTRQAYLYPSSNGFLQTQSLSQLALAAYYTYPIFPYEVIHDQQQDVDLPLVGEVITNPKWNDNHDDDNNNYPIVPYVQLPSTTSGGGVGNWGIDLEDLIAEIVNRAGQIITASALGQLINDFKNSLQGTDEYNTYNFYNNGDTYYIDYYSNTYNDIYNPVYNIDVSDQQEVIPVDLNTIQQYTNNQYLTVIKERAESFGETFGELVAFWHNCDPEIIYAFLGASIIVLLGAFIGKWGHS